MNDPVVESVRNRPRDLRGRGVVVAVSGGGDSVALLRILHALAPEFALTLSVAHVDHGARPGSVDDARFVAELAGSLRLPFDLAPWRPTRAGHFEADARAARYRLLAEIARNRRSSAVAVGHTRDDQAETILQRLLRGTGPRGLAGMPAARPLADGVTLIRPLLDLGRDDLRAFLHRLDQPFRDDPTNADRARTRNRLRHDLLPLLAEQYNPRIVDALVRLGRLSAEQEHEEEARARRDARRILLPTTVSGVILLDRHRFRRLSSSRRAALLRHLGREADWPLRQMTRARWKRLADLGDISGQRLSVGSGIEARTDEETMTLSRESTQPNSEEEIPEMAMPIPGEICWPGGRLVTVLDPAGNADETIDLDAIVPPVTVRAPRPGDRFTPLGMGGSTPLNDFFRGRRVPKEARGRVPLLCDASGIVWVAGHRIADRVRRRAETTRTLGLRWRPSGCD